MTYVVISLIASTMFLTAIAFVYAATGTVDMAQIAERMGDLPVGVQTAFALLLFVVFGVKAAVSSPCSRGCRTVTRPRRADHRAVRRAADQGRRVRGDQDAGHVVRPRGPTGSVPARRGAATMVVGVLAPSRRTTSADPVVPHRQPDRVHGDGARLLHRGRVGGAIFFLVNNILLKTALLLVRDSWSATAVSARLSAVGGIVRSAPGLAVLFALPALSLAGLPPFGGFVAKLGLVDAGVAAGDHVVVVVSLAVSLFTLYSMSKIWAGAFWGDPEETQTADPVAGGAFGGPAAMVLPTAAVVLAGLAVAAFAGPLWDLTARAAADLLGGRRRDRTTHLRDVAGRAVDPAVGRPVAANVLSGAAVAAFVLLVLPVREADDAVRDTGERLLTVRPLHAVRFLVWMSGQIVVASVRLAWEVVTPTNSIAMGVVRVPLRGVSDLHTTIVAKRRDADTGKRSAST